MCSGDLRHLVSQTPDEVADWSRVRFGSLFYWSDGLIKADIIKKVPRLNTYMFYNMFYYCTKLQEAPALHWMELADHCYEGMFAVCATLKSCPTLPAKILKTGCYDSMFGSCSSITSTPELPAETLASKC